MYNYLFIIKFNIKDDIVLVEPYFIYNENVLANRREMHTFINYTCYCGFQSCFKIISADDTFPQVLDYIFSNILVQYLKNLGQIQGTFHHYLLSLLHIGFHCKNITS